MVKNPQEEFKRLGIYTPQAVKELAASGVDYLIEDFMLRPSINILCGHSGLGKSPLVAQIGMSVASGKDFLNFKVNQPGRVLYCDAESVPSMFNQMQESLAQYIGCDEVPNDFIMWNPMWQEGKEQNIIMHTTQKLYYLIKHLKPKLVILDSLRNFYPLAAEKNAEAAKMIKDMRKYCAETGCSWLIVHHLRKTDREAQRNNQQLTLRHDTHAWFEEVAGSFSIVNNTDLRLGWEETRKDKSLWLGGFLRVHGLVGPVKMIRDLDEEGEPMGYRLAAPLEQLSDDMQITFESLPPETEFTFHTVRDLGRSRSFSHRFLKLCVELGLVQKTRRTETEGRPLNYYLKCRDQMWREDPEDAE